jgi:iron complex transport system substrate-binding protein
VALTDALHANEVIKGVSTIQHICDTALRQRTEAGEILEVGGEGNLNMEAILAANPEVVMASGMQSALFRKFNVLLQANIPVLVNSEWLESTLLGRAEWIKLMGALLNKEAEAHAHFDAVVHEYERLKELAATVNPSERKTVINGIPYKGTWYVAGGKSYFANLLKDAQADYHWADTETTGSLSMDFESVYPVALEADGWFPGEFIDTREALLTKDARFADFRSVQNENVYSNNKQMCEGGGNAYWVSGIVNPHWILADFIKILYPDLLPENELYYHKRLE